MTAADIIKAAIRKLGGMNSGETPSSDEIADGLEALNSMLDSLSIEGLVIPGVERQTHAWTANTPTYTLGTGGTFNTARPTKLANAAFIPTGETREFPLRLLTDDEWAGIDLKSLGGFPDSLYNDADYPLANLSIWPITTSGGTLVLYTETPITRFSASSTSFSMPPGYEEMLKTNLAIRLAPEYVVAVSVELAMAAQESKANVKRANFQPIMMVADVPTGDDSGYVDRSAFYSGK
jgi:hypothetical protein